jgi:hypothetical protein
MTSRQPHPELSVTKPAGQLRTPTGTQSVVPNCGIEPGGQVEAVRIATHPAPPSSATKPAGQEI